MPVVADKTRTLLHIFIDKIAEGQTILAYDDYAKDYTKQQFMTAIKRITDKMEVHIQREDKKYYLKLPLAYRITKKSPFLLPKQSLLITTKSLCFSKKITLSPLFFTTKKNTVETRQKSRVFNPSFVPKTRVKRPIQI